MIIKRNVNPNSFLRKNTYDFAFISDNKKLEIIFGGNLDLHLILSDGKIHPMDEEVHLYFDITKEDYEIYSLFDELYQDIINNKDAYSYDLLVDENLNINWASDDGVIDVVDILKIIRLDDDTYRLEFIRQSKIIGCTFKNPFNLTVLICNSGSRYKPFNVYFMKMYNKLQDIDIEYHQYEIEELDYLKRIKKL